MMVTYTSSALEHIHTVDTSPVHEQMSIITVTVCLLDNPQHHFFCSAKTQIKTLLDILHIKYKDR